jgi:hypothetical protein
MKNILNIPQPISKIHNQINLVTPFRHSPPAPHYCILVIKFLRDAVLGLEIMPLKISLKWKNDGTAGRQSQYSYFYLYINIIINNIQTNNKTSQGVPRRPKASRKIKNLIINIVTFSQNQILSFPMQTGASRPSRGLFYFAGNLYTFYYKLAFNLLYKLNPYSVPRAFFAKKPP